MTTVKKETGCWLIDCGSATRRTMGLPFGFFFEGGPPPFNLNFR